FFPQETIDAESPSTPHTISNFFMLRRVPSGPLAPPWVGNVTSYPMSSRGQDLDDPDLPEGRREPGLALGDPHLGMMPQGGVLGPVVEHEPAEAVTAVRLDVRRLHEEQLIAGFDPGRV